MSANEDSTNNNNQSSEKQPEAKAAGTPYSFGLDGYQYLHGQQPEKPAVAEAKIEATANVVAPQVRQQTVPAMQQATANWVDAEAQSAKRTVEYIETESHGRRAIIFTPDFKFKASLLNIFSKTDKDGDRRLSKEELYASMASGILEGDDELIVCMLWRLFDNIRRNKTSKTYFDARGITWDDVFNYEGWTRYMPESSMESDGRSAARPAGVVFQKKR